ncbi:NPCBM/NEW2 domain-containing protein [Streptomyces rubiginosohelvolus]|uniref:NPCBM/NEW2 domain-containing protein n=1 Tax=Streptomyces rubiginosohelvolus TaxID=67362 RepID=UPI003712B53E
MRHLPPPARRAPGRGALGAAVAVLLAAATLADPAQAAAAPAAGTAATPAPAPPMGFTNRDSTRCRAEFDEAYVKKIADILVSKGLKDAGYTYVNLDDCWAKPERDDRGRLVPDPVRFPNGIKALADHVHAKGLKFGLLAGAGTRTCDPAGFPGSLGHEAGDARQFADWGVDHLTYADCGGGGDAEQRYAAMSDALRATGRPVVLTVADQGANRSWEWDGGVAQVRRTTGAGTDGWGSVLARVKQNLPLAAHAGPGRWNDPDALHVGGYGMTETQYRTQFSLWSVMAAPLVIGSDLRKLDAVSAEILTNREVIAVDQDPKGKPGEIVASDAGRWVISKELADGSRAVALFNETNRPRRIATTAAAVGLPGASGYKARDLWTALEKGTAGTIAATVPAHGTVLLKVSADRKWSQLPPLLDTTTVGDAVARPGTTQRIASTVTNHGGAATGTVTVTLTGDDGWTARPVTAASTDRLKAAARLGTEWDVTVPAGATGRHELTLTTKYRSRDGLSFTSVIPVPVLVGVTRPPAGESYLGDQAPLAAANGWGPVEKDLSNGESNAGDGSPITINGTVFAKGLGVNSPSSVEYFTAGQCTRVAAQVGLDDEAGTQGTVTFEIWADHQQVASTPKMTNADAARSLTADVSTAETVRLVVTDGGDGSAYDHADWADLKITCA